MQLGCMCIATGCAFHIKIIFRSTDNASVIFSDTSFINFLINPLLF